MTKRISLLLLMMTSFVCYAQDKKWTLEECMQYAVSKSSKVNKQVAQNSIYHQSYLEAIGTFLPSVNASTSARFNFGRGLDGGTNSYVDVNSFGNGYDISSGLTLFDGLANINNLKLQRVNKAMGEHQLRSEKNQIAYTTMGAFISVLYYKGKVKLCQQQMEESNNYLRQIERMEELGLKSLPDVAEAKAKAAKDNLTLTRKKNELTIGFILLKEKMNFPIDENLDVEDFTTEKMISKVPETALAIYYGALLYLPEAMSSESSFESSKLNYRISKSSLIPRLSVYAGYGSNFYRYMNGSDYESFSNQLKNKKSYNIGFSLNIPIFNGFSNSGKVKRAKTQMIIAQNNNQETLRKIYSDIEQSVNDVNGLVDEYHQAKIHSEAMKVAHDMWMRKFKEGLVSSIEVSTSSNRLLDAQIEELNSLFRYYMNERLVQYYKGTPFVHE